MQNMRRRTAAIIGGGIGGLSTATALVRAGWHVEVYERSPELPTAGTALGMWPAAREALDLLGLGGALTAAGVGQGAGKILARDGRVLVRIDTSRRPAILASRPVILGLLADALPAEVLRLGTPAPPLEQLADRELVVGADGIWSRTRTELSGSGSSPRPLGMVAQRGWVDGEAPATTETWGRGALFGITARDGGLTNWFAAARTPPSLDSSLSALRARYAG